MAEGIIGNRLRGYEHVEGEIVSSPVTSNESSTNNAEHAEREIVSSPVTLNESPTNNADLSLGCKLICGVLLVCLSAIPITMMVGEKVNIILNCKEDVVIGVMLTIVAIMTVITFVLCICMYKHSNIKVAFTENVPIPLCVKVFFLFLFSSGSILRCIFYLNDIIKSTLLHSKCIYIAYNIILIVYILLLCIVVPSYRKFSEDSPKSAFCLLSLYAVNLFSLFCQAFLMETSEIMPNTCANVINTTDDYNITSAMEQDEHAYEVAKEILSPFHIEFCIIAIDILFSVIKRELSSSELQTEQTYSSIRSSIRECRRYLRSSPEQCVFPCIVFIINLFLVILAFALPSDSTDFFIAYQISLLVVKVLMIAFIIVTSMNIRDKIMKTKFHNFTISETILIFCTFGNIAYYTIMFIAVIEKNDDDKNYKGGNALVCIESIVNFILTFLQTTLLLVLQIYDPTTNAEVKDRLLNIGFKVLSTLSLGLWFTDTFGEIKQPVFTYIEYQNLPHDTWNTVLKILLPITIFYRFHAFIEYLELKHRYKIGGV